MILKETYSANHIRELQKRSKRDPALLERALHAFGLLEVISKVNMPFIFKGGTCLMLLLEHPKRLSTDIDIIVEPGTGIDKYIKEASKLFPFKTQEEQIRKRKDNILKRHFKFTYTSPITGRDIYILLDVLFEESCYSKLTERKIENELLLTDENATLVKVPEVNCILGDKLTAFAPHTIGIPIGRGKDMEVIKQMYDVCTLIEKMDNFDEVVDTYKSIAANEIAYRNSAIKINNAIQDTIDAALCIAARGKFKETEYRRYVGGIRNLRGHIFAENYSPEIAATRATSVIYLAACILKNSPFEKVTDAEKYSNLKFQSSELKALAYLKKIDAEAYAYAIKADQLLIK